MKKTILILGLLIIGACSLPTNSGSSLYLQRTNRESRIDDLTGPFGRLFYLERRIAKLESYEGQYGWQISEKEKQLQLLEFDLSTIRMRLDTFELRLDSVESKIKDLI